MCVKRCNKCDTEKKCDEFGVDSSKKDKLRTVCKLCSRKYDLKRGKTEKRKKYMKITLSKYRKSGKATESGKKHRKKYPKKHEAHKSASTAIRNKKLIKQPCEKCGELNVYAHHDDYNKHLDVRWLCDEHHRQWHRENGEGLNGRG